MKLEDQVCSLELAKRLKELGVKQASQFWWVHNGGSLYEISYGCEKRFDKWETLCSAFTVAELGEMLPWNYHWPMPQLVGEESGGQSKHIKYWRVKIHGEYLGDKTEADARAKMLIHLLENKIGRSR